jgi:hypothetical protein
MALDPLGGKEAMGCFGVELGLILSERTGAHLFLAILAENRNHPAALPGAARHVMILR